jgi:hypothetical protein
VAQTRAGHCLDLFIGIPAKTAETMLDRWPSQDTAKRSSKGGTGTGLILCDVTSPYFPFVGEHSIVDLLIKVGYDVKRLQMCPPDSLALKKRNKICSYIGVFHQIP